MNKPKQSISPEQILLLQQLKEYREKFAVSYDAGHYMDLLIHELEAAQDE